MKKFTLSVLALAGIMGLDANAQNLALTRVGGYETGAFDEGAAEIIAYSSTNHYLYSVNSSDVSVDIIDASNPASPSLVTQVDISTYGGSANCVAIGNGYFVVAVEHPDSANGVGSLEFFTLTGTHIVGLDAGRLPDNVNISPDGNYIVAANEGEPNDDYSFDAEGTVTVVDLSGGVQSLSPASVTQVSLTSLNGTTITGGITSDNPGSTVAQDLEPEYVTFNSTSTKAYVVCQENNVMLTIDLATASLESAEGLGFKDWSQMTHGFDASNKSSEIWFEPWNVFGVYQPDAMTCKNIGGTDYIFTANEGDGRDYSGYAGEERIKDITLDPAVFPHADSLQRDSVLGRLKIIAGAGNTDQDAEYEELYTMGGRSFSIWNASTMALVYDSEDEFEYRLASIEPDWFNSSNDESGFKDRSDDKGPEPEAITVGMVGTKYYAFIGLERIGGVMIYDVTDPANAEYVTYVTHRDFDADPTTSAAGDLGPECVLFISKAESGLTKDMIAVANEVSGSISFYEITDLTSTNEAAGSNDFKVFPNPTQDQVQVTVRGDYQVVNAMGQVLITVNNANTIDVSSLSAGVYFLRDASGATTQFVVTK